MENALETLPFLVLFFLVPSLECAVVDVTLFFPLEIVQVSVQDLQAVLYYPQVSLILSATILTT